MTSPLFDTQKEALAWLVPDAIDGAIEPFLGAIGAERIAELRTLLEDAVATHPRMRTFATRAAKTFLRVVERPLAEAAREDEQPKVVAVAPTPKTPALQHPGAANLADPALYKKAEGVIRALAKDLGKKSHYNVGDLISEGWEVAVEVSSKWDETQAKFETFLWTCARSRMRDKIKGAAHKREKPFGYYYSDTMHDDDGGEDAAEKCFRDSLNAFATSQVAGWLLDANPEELAAAKEARERLHEAIRTLPEKARLLLTKVLVEDTSLEDARKALKIPESTARLIQRESLLAIRAHFAKTSNVRRLPPRRPD